MIEQKQIGSGKSITSLVLGIIGIVAWITPLLGAPVTIVGLVLGIKGMKSKSRGMAIAGVVLCIIGIVLTIINVTLGAYIGWTEATTSIKN